MALVVTPGQFVQKCEQSLVHLPVIMCTQLCRRMDKAVFTRPAQILFGVGNKQFDHFRCQLHVALETEHQIAVGDNLTRAPFTVGYDRGIGVSPGISLCQ